MFPAVVITSVLAFPWAPTVQESNFVIVTCTEPHFIVSMTLNLLSKSQQRKVLSFTITVAKSIYFYITITEKRCQKVI